MWVTLQILNTILIFAAGILLATRIYPRLFESCDVTGHNYVRDLQTLCRQLSERPMPDDDTEFLKQKSVQAISRIAESLVDSQATAADTRSRTRLGLILLAVGTFIQSLLILFSR